VSNSATPAGGGWFRFGLGPAILCGAAWLIFWNEGGAERTAARLNEGARSIVEISSEAIDPANEGKLVHVAGEVRADEKLVDPELHVSRVAIKLQRVVEMYQWLEIEQRQNAPASPDGRPGVPTITYQHLKEWKSDWINSALFKQPAGHANPPALLLKAESWQAKEVKLGAFELTAAQLSRLEANTPVQLTEEQGKVALATGQGKLYRNEQQFLIRPDLAAVAKNMNRLTFLPAKSPPESPPRDVMANPQVGDLRVKYLVALPQEVTLIGRQQERQIVPYESREGGRISIFLPGRHSAESIFQSAQTWAQGSTWFFRALALGIVYVGMLIMLRSVANAESTTWLRPAVGSSLPYVRGGLAIAITVLLIGAAWLYYRPAQALVMIVVGGIFLSATAWLIWRLNRKQ
jgi:hypothetical protein